MKRKLSLLLCAVLMLSLFGCSAGSSYNADGSPIFTIPQIPDVIPDDPYGVIQNITPAATEPAQAPSGNLVVEQNTGEMTITRPEEDKSRPMGDPGTWTVFVYMCGSDLESSSNGLATEDLVEMLDISETGSLRFVVQTGGSYYWFNRVVEYNRNQRFVIENGEIELVDDQPLTGMGQSETLAEFLKWGVSNYGAEKMGVIFWNHGGGSITGVCFDEIYHYDSLSLLEIDAAFLSAYEQMTDKFEFVGFDACLMGTVETANIIANYARYMIASEESEPGSGWDYTKIGSYIAQHPSADGAQVGRIIADSFYESCVYSRDEELVTMSVLDLSKLDSFLIAFNDFSKQMYDEGAQPDALSGMIRNIYSVDNFGGNNKADGYTNMVDLGGLIGACTQWAPSGTEAAAALDDLVVYNVTGSDHPDATGLAIYYPLQLQGSEELSIFSGICVSPYYLSFVDRQSHASITPEEIQTYDDDTWFSNDGYWTQDNEYEMDTQTGTYVYEEELDEYWDYIEDYEVTGESGLVQFIDEPQLDDNGTYFFTLDEACYDDILDVHAIVFQLSDDGLDYIEMGETFDIYADWDDLYFADNFDGYWISLPDGQDLATYLVDVTEEYFVYSSPIYLNGEATNLRLRMYTDYSLEVEGAWAGIDDTGAASRDIIKIQSGDVICPRYYSYTVSDFEEGYYSGRDYTVKTELTLIYDIMDESDYYYAFWIDDLYGDYYLTDFVIFSIEDGELYYTLF